jgi:hypothetical protein
MSLLIVIRPENPALAVQRALSLQLARMEGKLTHEEFSAEFEKLILTQNYRQVGWLHNEVIVDEDCKKIGEIQPGDSFIRPCS